MQLQLHVTPNSPGYWLRCNYVTVREQLLCCSLDLKNSYGLDESYAQRPHVSFLKIRTDDDLAAFTRRWGPLSGFLSGFAPASPAAEVRLPMMWCWARQRRLLALVKLLNATRDRIDDRDALEMYVAAEIHASEAWSTESPPFILDRLAPLFPAGFQESPLVCIREADLGTVKKASLVAIRTTPVLFSAGFEIKLDRRLPEIVARWTLNTLDDALLWMVWRDESIGQPVLFCADCGKAFRRESKRKKIYCSKTCAHRVAVRTYKRKQRRIARKANRRGSRARKR